MKILIDIPKEFEVDYNTDRFAEYLSKKRLDAEMAQMRLFDIMPEVMP